MPGTDQDFKVGQPIKLHLNTKTDLTNATLLRIEYGVPPASEGGAYTYSFISATENPAGSKKVYGIIPSSAVTQNGQWKARPMVTFDYDPAEIPGEWIEFVVKPRY